MTQTITTQKQSFLKEWTQEQFIAMEKDIVNYFKSKGLTYTKEFKFGFPFRSLAAINETFGLSYTSSTSYAGLWVCNTEVYEDVSKEYHYVGFALGTNRKAYAILWDKEENEKIIEL